MDRYGVFTTTTQKILDGITLYPTAVVLSNGDAPIFSSRKCPNPIYYTGLLSLNEGDHKAPPKLDGVLVPVVQHICHYHASLTANLGNFFVPNVGFKRPESLYQVNAVLKKSPQSRVLFKSGQLCHKSMCGMYNITNALSALSVCRTLYVSPVQISQALSTVVKVFGRQEVIQLGAKKQSCILVKNPVCQYQVQCKFQTAKQPLWLSMLCNANTADGM